jgi:glucokinase
MAPERIVIGVDVGGTKVAAALVRGRLPAPGARSRSGVETPEILDRFTTPTDGDTTEECLRGIEACIADLEHGSGRVEGIGVGVASMVDFARGRVVESVNLPLTDVPLRDHLERRFGVPVVIDNDATAACIGEHVYGAGVGTSDMLMLTLGTGVGGGIISGGRPLRGFSGAAAEIGHIIVDVNGPKCPANCPNYGCLEVYAAGPAMGAAARAAAELEPDSRLGEALAAGLTVDGRLLTRLAREGDAGAIAVLERVGEYLGAGLVTLSNIFDPELVVIGGGAAAAGELLLAPARRVLADRALPPARDRVRVVPAALGPDAGFIGAAALALTELFSGDRPG